MKCFKGAAILPKRVGLPNARPAQSAGPLPHNTAGPNQGWTPRVLRLRSPRAALFVSLKTIRLSDASGNVCSHLGSFATPRVVKH